MTDAIDGDDGAVVAAAGAVIHLSSILALINHSFPVGVAAVVNYSSLVRLLFCKSARRIISKSIKMDSGPERRGQLETQHGSPVFKWSLALFSRWQWFLPGGTSFWKTNTPATAVNR